NSSRNVGSGAARREVVSTRALLIPHHRASDATCLVFKQIIDLFDASFVCMSRDGGSDRRAWSGANTGILPQSHDTLGPTSSPVYTYEGQKSWQGLSFEDGRD